MSKSRKSISYLNGLRRDVEQVLETIGELGPDIEAACFDLSEFPACDLRDLTGDAAEGYRDLVQLHKDLGKQLKALTIARDKYIEFF